LRTCIPRARGGSYDLQAIISITSRVHLFTTSRPRASGDPGASRMTDTEFSCNEWCRQRYCGCGSGSTHGTSRVIESSTTGRLSKDGGGG
jgi:hypothetical protein